MAQPKGQSFRFPFGIPVELCAAALVSTALHGVLLFPPWIAQPASVDVARGLASFGVQVLPDVRADAAAAIRRPTTPSAKEVGSEGMEMTPSMAPKRPIAETVTGFGASMTARPRTTAANQPPAYPRMARQRGWEGTVILRVCVQSDGSPGGVDILTGSGYAVLDRSAQAAVQRWRFLPAQRSGQATASMIELPIRFQLVARVHE